MNIGVVLVRCCLGVPLALASADAAFAQSPRVRDTVVVTAAATPVPFETLARAVIVLTREQIARLPVQSVPELLRFAVGLDVRTRGPFGVQADFSIRGASFGQALVLVDGVRLNDAQSGHHNGDIPVPLDQIERVEILLGAGSALHGADALGGTINVITRTDGGGVSGSLSAGDFGLVKGTARWAGREPGGPSVAVEAARSSGFTSARDFGTVTANAAWTAPDGTRIHAGYVNKEFGANNFYGPSPSREWTDQTLVALERDVLVDARWRASAVVSYRTHGDRFLWDARRPGMLENRHRTHAVVAAARVKRSLGSRSRVAFGGEAGGDWIGSSNLGDHRVARAGVYVELEHAIGSRAVVYPGVRFDSYSSAGSAWSPGLSGSFWIRPALRLRAAAGRAFRVPTFTELYYRDPAHQASGQLRPEQAWNVEGAADWFLGGSWSASLAVFSRRERDVIDWIREQTIEPWRTTNIHRVNTRGVEVELQKRFDRGFLALHYARLNSDAGHTPFISKYVLDFARDAWALKSSTALPAKFALGQRIAFTRRADGRSYWVADARLSRALGKSRLFVEATNLFDTRYQEINGIDMPGRWILAGIEVGRSPSR
jgi:outer membrane cobalamin receptor